jgi:hypothetical protein
MNYGQNSPSSSIADASSPAVNADFSWLIVHRSTTVTSLIVVHHRNASSPPVNVDSTYCSSFIDRQPSCPFIAILHRYIIIITGEKEGISSLGRVRCARQ